MVFLVGWAFSGLWVEALLGISEGMTRFETSFIEKALSPGNNARFLDVPCGGGRISLELARRGHSVTGVDVSAELLEAGRKKGVEEGLPVVWVERDMRNLSWEGEFDFAVCWGNSFGYFEDDGNERFLSGVYRGLRSGGRFLLGTYPAETLFPRFEARKWSRSAGGSVIMLQEQSYEVPRSRLDTTWILMKGNRVETSKSSIRIYTYREIRGMLERVGYRDIKTYGSKDLLEYMFNSPVLYLTMTKSAGNHMTHGHDKV